MRILSLGNQGATVAVDNLALGDLAICNALRLVCGIFRVGGLKVEQPLTYVVSMRVSWKRRRGNAFRVPVVFANC